MKEEFDKKPLSKEEKFVCEMIWGCIPLDVVFVRQSKFFQRSFEEFEGGKWKDFWEKTFSLKNRI